MNRTPALAALWQHWQQLESGGQVKGFLDLVGGKSRRGSRRGSRRLQRVVISDRRQPRTTKKDPTFAPATDPPPVYAKMRASTAAFALCAALFAVRNVAAQVDALAQVRDQPPAPPLPPLHHLPERRHAGGAHPRRCRATPVVAGGERLVDI